MKYNYKSTKTKKKIMIVGLGYVGLPLIKRFVDSKKYKLIGLDSDKKNLLKKWRERLSLL